jgi:ABC-2 type transport system ATP-binding protein
VTAVLEAEGLGKRYGRTKWALRDCSINIPEGHVVGLVGPNGAGKSTLLNLAVGLLAPTLGSVKVLDGVPAGDAAHLARVGFVAQDPPVHSGLSVRDHLRLGASMNPRWDQDLAVRRMSQLGIDPRQRAGKLSGGQRAQVALTLAIAKRPDVLILDEPVASLDPLARREFLRVLMETVADHDVSVVLSSHLVADIERVCDFLIVLTASRVQVAGDVEDLLATHHRLIGPRRDSVELGDGQHVIETRHTERQTTLFVRSDGPIVDASWTIEDASLEDLVLAYMGQDKEIDQTLWTDGRDDS